MRTLPRMTGRLLVGLTWIYCVVIVVLALLWLAGIQGIWWLDLANVFALCLFAPLLLLAPIAWLIPARRLRGAAILASDYSQFAARLHDTYRETNWGFGHTTRAAYAWREYRSRCRSPASITSGARVALFRQPRELRAAVSPTIAWSSRI
jgi:hypothetical protein